MYGYAAKGLKFVDGQFELQMEMLSGGKLKNIYVFQRFFANRYLFMVKLQKVQILKFKHKIVWQNILNFKPSKTIR